MASDVSVPLPMKRDDGHSPFIPNDGEEVASGDDCEVISSLASRNQLSEVENTVTIINDPSRRRRVNVAYTKNKTCNASQPLLELADYMN